MSGKPRKTSKAAFKKAHEAGAVLFFDEADSILGKRLTNVTQSADHGVNVSRSVMLLELDKFDGVVIFASNLPKNYDGAFVRRILAHIEFELPDADCLNQLWGYLLPDETPRTDDITRQWLAQESAGLSGGDILNVVKLAASQAVVRQVEDRRITHADIREAIFQVRNAKMKVGADGEGNGGAGARPMRFSQEIVSPEQLPAEFREEFGKKVAALN